MKLLYFIALALMVSAGCKKHPLSGNLAVNPSGTITNGIRDSALFHKNGQCFCDLYIADYTEKLCINHVGKRLVAKYPSSVERVNHTLIIYKYKNKIGAFTMLPYEYELTDLTLQ